MTTANAVIGPPKPIHAAIIDIMREVEAIGKTRSNDSQKYKFRGIDDVYNALNPLLSKHGVFTVPKVIEERREERQSKGGGTLIWTILKIEYTFFAADGSSVTAVITGEGMDSGDKSANKAMAVAHKYALVQIFSIPTEDLNDPDAESHALAGKKSPVKPAARPAPSPAAKPAANPQKTAEPSALYTKLLAEMEQEPDTIGLAAWWERSKEERKQLSPEEFELISKRKEVLKKELPAVYQEVVHGADIPEPGEMKYLRGAIASAKTAKSIQVAKEKAKQFLDTGKITEPQYAVFGKLVVEKEIALGIHRRQEAA